MLHIWLNLQVLSIRYLFLPPQNYLSVPIFLEIAAAVTKAKHW